MTNIPSVDPHYKQKRAITKKALRKIVYSYCCGIDPQEKTSYNEDAIIPEFLPLWNLFKRADFDFYSFMMNEDYNQIEDDMSEMRYWYIAFLFCTFRLPDLCQMSPMDTWS